MIDEYLGSDVFWMWYWDLYEMTFKGIQPCPCCGLNPSNDCGYLIGDGYWGDCDCEAPEEDLECSGCKYLICNECKLMEEK